MLGQRPKWPSNDPPQGFIGALWEQIETCWKQKPKERPTASNVLEALLAFGEAHQREPVTSVGDQDDDAMVEEWDHVGDGLKEGPCVGSDVTPGLTLRWFTAIPRDKVHREHPHLAIISDHMSSFLAGFRTPHTSGSDGHRSSGHRRRFGKHVRNILHLQRHPMAEPVEKREQFEKPRPVERPKPEIEFIDQREEKVFVRDDRVPYLVSRQIPEGRTLKKVVITVVSKDQGWSSYQVDHGTYRNSWTWFELSVGPSKDSEKWRGEVVRNLHAHDEFKEHTVEIKDGELYEKAKSGDVLTVWALAKHSGWKNTVKKVTIRYVVE